VCVVILPPLLVCSNDDVLLCPWPCSILLVRGRAEKVTRWAPTSTLRITIMMMISPAKGFIIGNLDLGTRKRMTLFSPTTHIDLTVRNVGRTYRKTCHRRDSWGGRGWCLLPVVVALDACLGNQLPRLRHPTVGKQCGSATAATTAASRKNRPLSQAAAAAATTTAQWTTRRRPPSSARIVNRKANSRCPPRTRPKAVAVTLST
jgi:hypothetical protein